MVTAFSVSVSSLQVAEHSQHEIATAGLEGLHLAAKKSIQRSHGGPVLLCLCTHMFCCFRVVAVEGLVHQK